MSTLSSLQISTAWLPCPLCHGTRFEPLAAQDRYLMGLPTVGCLDCGLVQTNPRPSKESMDLFYSSHYRRFYQGVMQPDDAYVMQYNKDVRLRYTVDFLGQRVLANRQLAVLDYGCGEGSLFIALREGGFSGQLVGVEPNAEFGRFASERGRALVHATLGAVGKVDVAVINHVLEHLPDPIATLLELKQHLADEGNLYIDVPDVEEYGSTADLHIAHLLHFSVRTLRRLVESAGYVVLLCEKHNPPYHPRSVRLVARMAQRSIPPSPEPTTPASEAQAWNAVRRVQASAWKWVLKKRLACLPFARTVHSWVRARP